MKICPNCGKQVDLNIEFCPNCGQKLSQPEKQTNKRFISKKNYLNKQKKILFSIIGFLIIVFIGFYAWGSNHFSEDKQIDQIISSLTDSKANVAQYLTTDNVKVTVNSDTVKPLQAYYRDHKQVVKSMKRDFKNGAEKSENTQLVKVGHYLLFFPKYMLKFHTYMPTVNTNHPNTTLSLNHKKVGNLSKNSNSYSKKIGPILPGKYQLLVNSKVSGHNLSAASTVNVWSNKQINMNIATKTFTVASVPNGKVYINDKFAGKLDEKGYLKFNEYPISKNMTLYVTTSYKDKKLKSIDVNDLGTALDIAVEKSSIFYPKYSIYISKNDSKAVYKIHGKYYVTPQWQGLATEKEAESAARSALVDPKADDYIGGKSNPDFVKAKKIYKSFTGNGTYVSDSSAKIKKILPAGKNYSSVDYEVHIQLDNAFKDIKRDKIVLKFKDALIYKPNDIDPLKIKTIGEEVKK